MYLACAWCVHEVCTVYTVCTACAWCVRVCVTRLHHMRTYQQESYDTLPMLYQYK